MTSTMIPLDLQVSEFLEIWESFERHRKQLKKPLTAEAAKRILKDCSRWGAWYARVLLDLAIVQGWRKPFEPDRYRTHEFDGFRFVWNADHLPFYYHRRAA